MADAQTAAGLGRVERYRDLLDVVPEAERDARVSMGAGVELGAATGAPARAKKPATMTSRRNQGSPARLVPVRVATRATTGAGARCTSRLPRSLRILGSTKRRPSTAAAALTAARPSRVRSDYSSAATPRMFAVSSDATAHAETRPPERRVCATGWPRTPARNDYLIGLTVNEVEAVLEQVENFFLIATD